MTHTRALSNFCVVHKNEANNYDFFVEIKTKKRLYFSKTLAALSDFFHSISYKLQVKQEEFGAPAYGGASDVTVSSNIRNVMAQCLQKQKLSENPGNVLENLNFI